MPTNNNTEELRLNISDDQWYSISNTTTTATVTPSTTYTTNSTTDAATSIDWSTYVNGFDEAVTFSTPAVQWNRINTRPELSVTSTEEFLKASEKKCEGKLPALCNTLPLPD